MRFFDPPFDKSDLIQDTSKATFLASRKRRPIYARCHWTVMAIAAGGSARAWELFTLINPIKHGATPEADPTYRVEPYVVAADVYVVSPHTGRGGWTWYTGSAGWMYRLLIETLLGVNLEGDHLRLTPSLPKTWNTFTVHYRYRETVYHLRITRSPGNRPTAANSLSTAKPLMEIGWRCRTIVANILWRYKPVAHATRLPVLSGLAALSTSHETAASAFGTGSCSCSTANTIVSTL